jgi:hypothetical protein
MFDLHKIFDFLVKLYIHDKINFPGSFQTGKKYYHLWKFQQNFGRFWLPYIRTKYCVLTN